MSRQPSGSLYQRYGVEVDPSTALQSQQNNTTQGFKDALASIEDLFLQQKQKQIDSNTANFAEALKQSLRSEGLGGGGTINEAGIKQRYGSMIDIDSLKQTASATRQGMEEEAVNTVGQEANEILSQTNDPLAAKQHFTKRLRELGGKESFVSTAEQAWNDSNATRFEDAKEFKLREQKAGEEQFLGEVSNGVDVGIAIEARIADLPKNEQAAERRRLWDVYEEDSALTDSQKEAKQFYRQINLAKHDQNILEKNSHLESLQQQFTAAQNTGIDDTAYELAKKYSSDLGVSPTASIGDMVTNWVESWDNENDANQVKLMYNDLIDSGVASKDANAAIALAFNEVYPGDSWTGNNITPEGIARMRERVEDLGQNLRDRYALQGQISEANKALSQAQLDRTESDLQLDRQLTQAGRDTRMRIQGKADIPTAYKRFLQKLDDATAEINGAGAKGTGTGDNTPAPVDVDPSDPNALLNLANQGDNLGATEEPPPPAETTEEPAATPDPTTDFKGSLAEATNNPYAKNIYAGSKDPIGDAVNKQSETLSNAKFPSTAERADALRDLAPKEQEAALGKLEQRIGKSLTDKVRQKLKEQPAKAPEAQAQKAKKEDNVVAGVDLTVYATDNEDGGHEQKVKRIYNKLPDFKSAADVDKEIKRVAKDSPVTGEMVMEAAEQYDIDPKLLVAVMRQDSNLGTKGKGLRTLNPGNIGNDDTGREVTFDSWEEGVLAVAKFLKSLKVQGVA